MEDAAKKRVKEDLRNHPELCENQRFQKYLADEIGITVEELKQEMEFAKERNAKRSKPNIKTQGAKNSNALNRTPALG